MNEQRINMMKNQPVSKAINTFALPAIVGLMVMTIYNVVDTMFVAWIGTEATGATQVILPIMMLASTIGQMFGAGGGSYLSRLLGKGDIKQAEKTASTALLSGIGIGIIFTVLNLSYLEPILGFFGAYGDVMHYAREYGIYIILGSVVTIADMITVNLLRSEGSANVTMIGLIIGSIMNMILDPLFIFVLGWGIAGAAIATIISQIVTFVILFSYYLTEKTVIRIRLRSFTLKWSIYREILVIGIPTFFRQLLVSISMAFLNQSASTYGDASLLASIGILIKVQMIPMNIVFGLGQGFQPVAGYNIGAKNSKRVIEAFRYTIVVSTMVTVAIAILLNFFSINIFSIFRVSDEVLFFGLPGLRYYSIGIIFTGIANTVSVFYQAIGRGLEALVMSISRQGLFLIPVILVLPMIIGTDGILMSQMIADIMTFLFSLILIIPFIKNNGIEKMLQD